MVVKFLSHGKSCMGDMDLHGSCMQFIRVLAGFSFGNGSHMGHL